MQSMYDYLGILFKQSKILKPGSNPYLLVDISPSSTEGLIEITNIDTNAIRTINIDNPGYIDGVTFTRRYMIYNVSVLKEVMDNKVPWETVFHPEIGLIGSLDRVNVFNQNQIRENLICKRIMLDESINSIILTDNNYKLIKSIQNTDEFKIILNLKSSDGAVSYKADKDHIMKLSTGMIPILKSDDVNVHIIDIPGLNEFFAIFEILKKKVVLKQYMRFIRI